jgi:hypothetical protein
MRSEKVGRWKRFKIHLIFDELRGRATVRRLQQVGRAASGGWVNMEAKIVFLGTLWLRKIAPRLQLLLSTRSVFAATPKCTTRANDSLRHQSSLNYKVLRQQQQHCRLPTARTHTHSPVSIVLVWGLNAAMLQRHDNSEAHTSTHRDVPPHLKRPHTLTCRLLNCCKLE